MNKNKKLKNKKRYLGNPFTVAFLPVLASVGLTLGATSLTMKSKNADIEIYKQHEIEIVQPSEEHHWAVSAKTLDGVPVTSAKKGDVVVFHVDPTNKKKANDIEKEPIGVKINTTTYDLDSNYDAIVTIPFVDKMTVTVVFPEPKRQTTVTFDLGYEPEEGKPRTSEVKVVIGEKVERPHDPERAGYSFLYWYETDDTQPFDFDTVIQERTYYLTAKWETGPAATPHKIFLNDGSEWTFSVETLHEDQKAIKGESVTFIAKHDPWVNLEFPYAVNLKPHDSAEAGITYPLQVEQAWEVYKTTITVPYETDMDATLLFKPGQEFVVSFNSLGGPSVDSQSIEAGNCATEPTPQWIGHTLAGWYTIDPTGKTPEELADKKWDFSKPIFEAKTLYAKWDTDTYTISFTNWDDTKLINDITVKYGEVPVYTGQTPTHVDPTGQFSYTFIGWDTPISAATGDKTYKAQFTHTTIAYTVQYNSNGGESVKSAEVLYGLPIQTRPEPKRAGWTLEGWYYNDGGSQRKWVFGSEASESTPATLVKGNVVLTANWTQDEYTATFLNEEGAQTPLYTQSGLHYDDVPVYEGPEPTPPSPTQVFLGWNPTLGPIKKSTTYVARFGTPATQHTVTFDSNGGTSVFDELTIVEGSTIPEDKEPTTSRTGYTFEGWFNGEDKWVFGSGGTPVTTDLRLTAKWSPTQYDITFLNDDDTPYGEPIKSPYGSMPTTPENDPIPQHPIEGYNYTFEGWSPKLAPVSGATTYKATFSQTIKTNKVTFETNGAKQYIEPKVVEYNSTVVEPTIPVKDHYVFKGWYKESTFDTKWDFANDKVTEPTTLYAKWEIQKFTIRFEHEDSTETYIDPQVVEYGETPVCAVTPTKTDPSGLIKYTFAGWKDTETQNIGIIPANSDATYKPVFKEEGMPMLVTFNTHEGSAIDPIYVRYNNKIDKSVMGTSTKYGCIIVGWFKDAEYQQPWDLDNDVVTEPITLHAKWDYPTPTTINYELNDDQRSYRIKSAVTTGMPYIKFPGTHINPDTQEELPVTGIGDGAFIENKDIEKVKLPESVENLGYHAFGSDYGTWGNAKLNEINLEHVKTWGKGYGDTDGHALRHTSISDITLCDDNTIIYNSCFVGSSIKTIKSNRTSTTTLAIQEGAFWFCTNITSITLPRYISLGTKAFYKVGITRIQYEGTRSEWDSIYSKSIVSGESCFYYSSIAEVECLAETEESKKIWPYN